MKINSVISPAACSRIKEEIHLANGNEVFFRGTLNEDGLVTEVEVIARGNRSSAPAIIKRMRREEVIIHNHPSGYLYPSDADIGVASHYANNMNGGFYIVNNSASEVYVVVEVDKGENININIDNFFKKDGEIAKHFPEFEYRVEQLHMAKIIEEGFNSESKVVVEAGTGTGKTLAYLIPGIEWAVKNKKRIIFSTNTINLQEQLLNKDLPLAKKVLGYDFKYMLVKGRGNYLCNRKYFNYINGEHPDMDDFSISQKNQFREIEKWGSKTESGDKAELLFEVDSSIWEVFASETDTCLGNRCPYRKDCFFHKVKDEKKKMDVLITNHHLYFTDLAIRKEVGFTSEFALLPEYHAVVFDEAHNVEKVARDYFSAEASKMSYTKTLNKILNVDKPKKKSGIYYSVENEVIKQKSEESKKLLGIFKEEHFNFVKNMKRYFNDIIELFTNEKMETASVRLKKDDPSHKTYIVKLHDSTREFLIEYSSYSRVARPLIRNLKELSDDEGYINDFIKYIDRIDELMSTLKVIDEMEESESIYWVEVNRKRGFVKRVLTPLKIDSELKKNLFINLKTIIFTSATIAVGNSFKYFKDSVGLDESKELVVHSPFDYDKQMKVYIPTDMPDPTSKEFINEVSEFLKISLVASKGRAFVLFTAYSALNYVYYSIREQLQKEGIELFIHGTLPRGQLVQMFKVSDKPVLLGTDSFWEGVDIKGEQLSNVIIVKLPFKVPNDPITEAVIESITANGGNSFTDYQIPEAVIKFKQGIGRLIRSKSDSGTITILDNRVVTKKYGEFFMEALPTNNILKAPKNRIIKAIFKDMEE